MSVSSEVFKIGTRASKLALVQAHGTLDHIQALLPAFRGEVVPFSTPGDRDRRTDLRESPPDFFTRDLDEAVRSGAVDCSVHSAKDLPDPVPAGLDWFWLPWTRDPRDCLVLPPGRSLADLPAKPRVGVSSVRREAFCRKRFPAAILRPIRGNIEERIRQLDNDDFDLLIMAGAALVRLGMNHRITEWISEEDLPPPDGQGSLAVTFRSGDARFLRLRSLFVKSVVFAGAGAGDASLCTLAAVEALRQCDVCLYDALMDARLLAELTKRAQGVDVGKRSGNHALPQDEISALIARYARRGLHVVRLKGGDPGLFGRLAEEIELLDALRLPYRVVPGVSSMLAATTGTGMLLTRRGVSRGFCAMTPRTREGTLAPVGQEGRAALPMVFFMATSVCRPVMDELQRDGTPAETPAAAIFDAGAPEERIVEGTVGTLADCLEQKRDDAPGLLLVGDVARYRFHREWGALQGQRVLLTCSDVLLNEGIRAVWGLGGMPVPLPLVRLTYAPDATPMLARVPEYDWVVLTSPSAVRRFSEGLAAAGLDVRRLPKIAVCGPGTARELRHLGLVPDCEPSDGFGADGLLKEFGRTVTPGARVMRCRSDVAGETLANELRKAGAQVDDVVLYRNTPVPHETLPPFEAVVFASGSAATAFVGRWGIDALKGKTVAAIGAPTARTLERLGRPADVLAHKETIEACVETLATRAVNDVLKEMKR